MGRIDPQAEALIKEYLDCLNAKEAADSRLKLAKQTLLDYSRQIQKKTFSYTGGQVTVSVKKRTVFPKYNQPGRRELEQAVKDANYWDEAQSFDVIKLAQAYDDDRLPQELKEKLAGLAKSDAQVRIFINEKK